MGSARSTCPNLANFRICRVQGWRRVFQHPAAIFFERGIARPDTCEIASLSAEPADADSGFVVAAFEIPSSEVGGLLEREVEFDFAEVPIHLESGASCGSGYMCCKSTDLECLDGRGLREKYASHGLTSIWDEWGRPDSGIKPCPVYCRHCVLATQREGVPKAAYNSFLDETFLVDRKTTLREYLSANGEGSHVMSEVPPESVRGR